MISLPNSEEDEPRELDASRREYLSPGGEAVSAGIENGDDECCYDKSELPANGDGGWVKDVGSCARGGAG